MSRRWAPSLALPAAIPEDEALGAERRDADEPAPATRAQLDAAEAALRKMEADLDAIGASLGGASPERRRSSGGSASSESAPRPQRAAAAARRAAGRGGPRPPASPVYDIASATTPESSSRRGPACARPTRLAGGHARGDAAEADCAFVCGVTAVSHECAPATATCAYADANYDHGAGVLAPEPPRGRECDDDGDDALAALGICSVAPSSCTVM
ncbi:hypothetical protein JL722_721 [Aureococcus anophagefferens]|nr:hypothetical protein JL722_721 [Aureococcus anophagefferens]